MTSPPSARELGRVGQRYAHSTVDVAELSLPAMSQTLQYLTDEHGDRTAVVLPISDYEKLLEDLDDLAVVAERRDEPVISHDAFVADLQRDGTL